jgi:hypothetical protein
LPSEARHATSKDFGSVCLRRPWDGSLIMSWLCSSEESKESQGVFGPGEERVSETRTIPVSRNLLVTVPLLGFDCNVKV